LIASQPTRVLPVTAGGRRAVGERDCQHAVGEGPDHGGRARRLSAEVLQPVAALTIAVAVAIAGLVPVAAAIVGAMVASDMVAG
jgi:hypothetical protein